MSIVEQITKEMDAVFKRVGHLPPVFRIPRDDYFALLCELRRVPQITISPGPSGDLTFHHSEGTVHIEADTE